MDVALARLHVEREGARTQPAGLEALAFTCAPFPEPLAESLRKVLDGVAPSLEEVAMLHRDLGLAFGRAVAELAAETGHEPAVVGSHGQTVWHHDGAPRGERATLQLGDADHLAERAGCWVVSDFRQADLAAGGEGAPLSALVDGLLFPELPRPACVLNLGGFGNLTLLGEGSALTAARDTGPAGALLDGLARRLLDAPMDEDGAVAMRGAVNPELLNRWMEHPFFEGRTRSTGRDTFGEAWVSDCLAAAQTSGTERTEDVLATAAGLVAEAVAWALEREAPGGLEAVVVAGGGVHHARVLKELAARTGLSVVSSQAHGVDPDAREALGFAALGAGFGLGWGWGAPEATGGARGRLLGRLSPPGAH
jgi:anhydro-N-acetylmuramic acid kinase